MSHEAVFWTPLQNNVVQCGLCPHHCTIADGKTGICGVRRNEQGRLFSLIYGLCSSVAADPIEKKPLYHFHPGSRALSLGSVGCTFRCDHCQNYSISMASPEGMPLQELAPDEVVDLVKARRCQGVAWTYNEPTIWHEYALESMRLVKKAGLYTVYVTNGYIEEAPLKQLAGLLDALNVDIKAFTEEFYKKVCKARLEPVLQTCVRAKQLGMHLEVTYLVIPGYNDTAEEISRFCRWVAENLGGDTPVHFSRFHPDYKMTQTPSTPMETLLRCHHTAHEAGLQYVYLGNISHGDYENTYCPSCGGLLVERSGFSAMIRHLAQGRCTQCRAPIPVVMG